MARGKNAAQAARRRAAQNAAQADALRAEIAAEEQTLAEVEAQVAEVDALRDQLAEATTARTDGTAPERERLREEVRLLTTALSEHREHAAAVQTEWERTTTRVIEALGGGREGLEKFMALVHRTGYLADPPRGAKVGIDAITRLQLIRGERSRAVDLPEDSATRALGALLPLLPAQWRSRLRDAGVDLHHLPDDLKATDPPLSEVARSLLVEYNTAAEAVMRSTTSALTPASMSAWHPLPLLALDLPHTADGSTDDGRAGDHDEVPADGAATHPSVEAMFTALGPHPGMPQPPASAGTGPAATTLDAWPLPSPALSASTRQRLAATSPDQLLARWHDPLRAHELLTAAISGRRAQSWALAPRSPLPGYASTVRHLYTKAAIGAWVRTGGTTAAAPAGTDRSPDGFGEAAVALTAAAPFWMPAGQTHAFADSDPLDETDLADLLLPFPQVLLTFAEPLDLPPIPMNDAERRRLLGTPDLKADAGPDENATYGAAALADLDTALVKLTRGKETHPDLTDFVSELADPAHLGVLSVGQLLALRGAKVEALLLLADSLGRLTDHFAWCLAIPGRHTGVLARVVVPASLWATAYRAQVLNLAAVAAWAGWHEPDTDTALPPRLRPEDIDDLTRTPGFRRDANRAGAGGVRVLDVKATVTAPSTGEVTGRHVAPHVRRGHWRRQRHGPGARQVKRIRIAPVTVNAHLGESAPRVYRLPGPSTGSSRELRHPGADDVCEGEDGRDRR